MTREETVLAAVDELAGELVELLQALVRLPTINPPGEGYEAFVRDFAGRLGALGYATEVHRVPEEDLDTLAPHAGGRPRPNLLATLENGDGPTVHLNGHYDVVPVGNDWTTDPFGGELRDGWIYGRGAADMKSGLAAQVIAVEALRRTSWNGRIVQSAVPDEETVGVRNAGMGWLVEQGLIARRRADHHRAVRPRRRRVSATRARSGARSRCTASRPTDRARGSASTPWRRWRAT